MSRTMREKFIEALEKRGSVRVESRSGKYVTLTRPDRQGFFYFVGESGGLRTGTSSSRSVPCRDSLKKQLLESVG